MGTLYAATLGQSPGVARIYIYINIGIIYIYIYWYIYIYIGIIYIHIYIIYILYVYIYYDGQKAASLSQQRTCFASAIS